MAYLNFRIKFLFLYGSIILIGSTNAFVSPALSLSPLKTIPSLSLSLQVDAKDVNEVDVCIIGAGISGLTAATTIAEKNTNLKVCVLEASAKPGGRVRSDITSDGFVLDRGFAVFIECYPQSKEIFDYDLLKLKRFDPGSLIKIPNTPTIARVADPLRQPKRTIDAITSPVGEWKDKLRLVPLLINVKRKSIEDLFDEDEVDTLSCLKNRYKFSERMINEFFKPFLEGIYLTPLEQQSSRMFHFVFKMFSDGAVSLPTMGMQAVPDQLAARANNLGVEFRMNHAVNCLSRSEDDHFLISSSSSDIVIRAKKVICAVSSSAAKKLLAALLPPLSDLDDQPERSVACMYYSFQGEPPVNEPILILNGEGKGPVNNICFPSVINDSYAPKGYSLCSVALTTPTMEKYRGREDELDRAVRAQLADWFGDYSDSIMFDWERKGDIYEITNAQPSQIGGPFPANVHLGRDCTQFRGLTLGEGLFICGDFMSTATLNGAIESGFNAALSAIKG